MNEIVRLTNQNKEAVIKTNGGSYFIDLYKDNELIESKEFNEHTLRIVENYGKEWINRTQT